MKWNPEVIVRGQRVVFGETAVYGNRKFRLIESKDGVKLLAAPYRSGQHIRVYKQLLPISVLYDMGTVKEIVDDILESIPSSLFEVE